MPRILEEASTNWTASSQLIQSVCRRTLSNLRILLRRTGPVTSIDELSTSFLTWQHTKRSVMQTGYQSTAWTVPLPLLTGSPQLLLLYLWQGILCIDIHNVFLRSSAEICEGAHLSVMRLSETSIIHDSSHCYIWRSWLLITICTFVFLSSAWWIRVNNVYRTLVFRRFPGSLNINCFGFLISIILTWLSLSFPPTPSD